MKKKARFFINILLIIIFIMFGFRCILYAPYIGYENLENKNEEKEEIVTLSFGDTYKYNFHIHNPKNMIGQSHYNDVGRISEMKYSLSPTNNGLMLYISGIFECISAGSSYNGMMGAYRITCELTIKDENGLVNRMSKNFRGDEVRSGEKTACECMVGPLPLISGTNEIQLNLCRY